MTLFERIDEKAARENIPIRVHLDLTYRCHQSCIHCFLPESLRRGEQAGREMNTAQVKNILDQLAAADTFWLTFSSGEIFLRPDLFDLLAYARRRNFLLSLFTSGTCGLGAPQIRTLTEIGIEAMFVSLYGITAPVHDKITGVPGSWNKLQATIKQCRDAGLRLVFNCTALGLNLHEIPAIKDYARRLDIPLRLGLELTDRWDGRAHPHGLRLSAETWKILLDVLYENEQEDPPSHSPTGGWEGCNAGVNSCYINPSGEVLPCMDIPWTCGRLSKGDRFQGAWEDSAVFHQVRHLQGKIEHSPEVLCDLCRRFKTPDGIMSALNEE